MTTRNREHHRRDRRVSTWVAVGTAMLTLSGWTAAPALAAGTKDSPVVVNGGFEHGIVGWRTAGAANVFGGNSHRGFAHLDMVALNGVPVASAVQRVHIPLGMAHPQLRFWTEDWSCGAALRFTAQVFHGGRDTILQTINGSSCGTGWVLNTASLASFRGMTVSLRFVVRSLDGSSGDLFYLDDVSVRDNRT